MVEVQARFVSATLEKGIAEDALCPYMMIPVEIQSEQLDDLLHQLHPEMDVTRKHSFFANDLDGPIISSLSEALQKVGFEQKITILYERRREPKMQVYEMPSSIKCLSRGQAGLFDGTVHEYSDNSFLKTGHKSAISCMAWYNSVLITGSLDCKVRMLGKADPLFHGDQTIQSLYMQDDYLFIGMWNGKLAVKRPSQKKPVNLVQLHKNAIVFIASIPGTEQKNENFLLTASWDHHVSLWRVAGQDTILPVHNVSCAQIITAACLLEKEHSIRIVCAHPNGQVTVFSVDKVNHQLLLDARWQAHRKGRVSALCQAPPLFGFFTAGEDDRLILWDAQTHKVKRHIPYNVSLGTVQALDYSDGSVWIAQGRHLSNVPFLDHQ